MEKLLNHDTGNFKFYELIFSIFGDFFPSLLCTIAVYSRIKHGWDRIYLLPLAITPLEPNLLEDLKKQIKRDEIDDSMLENIDMLPDYQHVLKRDDSYNVVTEGTENLGDKIDDDNALFKFDRLGSDEKLDKVILLDLSDH